jgi:catechol 2,3-dioxygenase-like lactoylglutathione lyase family enzyme
MNIKPHHVGIVVSDLERSTEFYRALGFETVSEIPWEDGSRAIRFVRSGELELELFWYAQAPAVPAVPEGKQLGFRHLAFIVEDIDEVVAELKAADVMDADVEIHDVPIGFRLAFFHDPDGLEIELSQPV